VHIRLFLRGLAAALLIALSASPIAFAQSQALAGDIASGVPALEAETADFEAIDWELQDGKRGREVPVRLYLPKGAAADAPLPLVVFSHGLGGSRQGYSYLGRYWASQGIAALHVQHVGSDRRIWLGNPLGLVSRLQDAAQEREAEARALDVRFALDQLLASERGARIDRERIAVAGHSYGANTSLLLAGAQIRRTGQAEGTTAASLRDPRIKAAILISAPPFHGHDDTAAIVGAIRIPTLHITATEDVIRVPGYYSEAADRVALFEATGSANKELVVFAGGSHSIFTDRAGTGGVQLNPRVKAATRELTLAFLNKVFEGRDDGLRRWVERHADLIARLLRSS
jgi:predicted dienelactone hydrolase